MKEPTMAMWCVSAKCCNVCMVGPSIPSANSGWSVQNPVVNISGNNATSALPANAAIRSDVASKFACLSAHRIGYCNKAILNTFYFFFASFGLLMASRMEVSA